MACLRWYPVSATNSSRVRPFSAAVLRRYRSATAFTNSCRACGLIVLGGQFKTGHLWTPQNRPFPAPETGVDLYFIGSCVRKVVCTLVRQLRGPHFSTCA